MKTTIDLPDELLIAAKKTAAERRTTLKEIVAAGIRRELGRPEGRGAIRRKRPIRWVTAKGGLAPGLDVSNREKMYDWIQRHR